MITLCYHRPLDEHWHTAANQLAADLNVSIIGRSKGKRDVIGHDYVVENSTSVAAPSAIANPKALSPSPTGR